MKIIKILSLRFSLFALILAISIFTFNSCSKSEKQPEMKSNPEFKNVDPATLDNLKTAYDGESNANRKYLAFARMADSEGFPGIASLFRAAARAEEIHAKNHLDVIHKFGKEAVADIKAPEVKSTKENLEAAIKGETYEMNEMYPQFLAAARKEKQKDAIKTFNGAMEAEKEHAKLYAEALANMDKNKVGAIEFMVCPTCGYTLKKAKLEKCPVCFTPGEKFEIVK